MKTEKGNSDEKRHDFQFIDDIRQNSAEHKLQDSNVYPKNTDKKLHKNLENLLGHKNKVLI